MGVLMVLIGGSGFKYIETPTNGWNNHVKKTVTVKNATNDEIAFILKTDTYKRYNATASKTFFGFDNRYYHIIVYWNAVKWGQIQSDGSVIQKDRTVLTHLDFYPMGVTPTTVPKIGIIPPTVPKIEPVIKPPAVPAVSAVPTITGFKDAEKYMPEVEEILWIKKIKNLLQKLKTWMINLLNR